MEIWIQAAFYASGLAIAFLIGCWKGHNASMLNIEKTIDQEIDKYIETRFGKPGDTENEKCR